MKQNPKHTARWGASGMAVPAFLVGILMCLGFSAPVKADGVHFGFDIRLASGHDDYYYGDDYDVYYDDYDYGDDDYRYYDMNVDVWVERGYRSYRHGGAYVRVHVNAPHPAYIALYGVTPRGELIFLHPWDPYEVRVYGPTVLDVRLPDRAWHYADDLVVFAVASPRPVLPLIPYYLVPARWWDMGFHYGHGRFALEFGFVYYDHGHYYIHGDPYHVTHYIYRDFRHANRRFHHNVCIGHTRYDRRHDSHVTWSRGYLSDVTRDKVIRQRAKERRDVVRRDGDRRGDGRRDLRDSRQRPQNKVEVDRGVIRSESKPRRSETERQRSNATRPAEKPKVRSDRGASKPDKAERPKATKPGKDSDKKDSPKRDSAKKDTAKKKESAKKESPKKERTKEDTAKTRSDSKKQQSRSSKTPR